MKKNAKKNYQFGAGQKKVATNGNFIAVFQKYMNNPFTMNHELAHKKVIDHFFPEDPAEIYEVNGRPMTGNKFMKNHDVREVYKDKNYLEIYKKIVIAGYVQEIIDLGLEDYFEQILTAQMQNVKQIAEFCNAFGGEVMLWQNCYTNDDGKFYYLCKQVGRGFNQIVNDWIEAGKWCKNFLKAA